MVPIETTLYILKILLLIPAVLILMVLLTYLSIFARIAWSVLVMWFDEWRNE